MSAPLPSLAARWLRLRLGVSVGVLALACLVGCPRPGPGPDNPETPTSEASSDTSEANEGEGGEGREGRQAELECGVDTRFEDYTWIPSDTRLATAVERDPPEALADALAQLRLLVDDPQHRLPIFAALDYRNLELQLGSLDRLLVGLDFAPSEVVELQSPKGDFVWLWPTDCPRELLAARVLERHGLMLRVDLDHPKLRRAAGSPETLPFDLLVLGERRMAMTLAGRGAAIGAWLDGAGVGAGDDAPAPGERLAEIAPAPIRSVLAGESLLSTAPDDPATPSSPSLRQLRATATDATLENPS